MSDLIFNIRFGKYHLQVHRNWPVITFRRNYMWDIEPPPCWFEVYHWFGRYVK